MTRIDTAVAACTLGWLGWGMVGCSPTVAPPSKVVAPTASPAPLPTQTPLSSQPPIPKPSEFSRGSVRSGQPSTTGKQVTVNIYRADGQCLNLVPAKVAVNAGKSLDGAIAKILENNDSADFSVSGYRVNVRNGIATVDLQPKSGSKRGFYSLSACEQMALFGSIQKTLTSNSRWQIQSVRFTQKGKQIVF